MCRIQDAQYKWESKLYTLQKFSLNGAALHGLIYDRPFQLIEQLINTECAEVELKYSYPGI